MSWSFAKSRINQRHRHAMKGEIPRRVPRVFPFVRHGNDVGIVQVDPLVVAALTAARIRRGLRGIAAQPAADVVVITLLAPEQSGESLALHAARVLAQSLSDLLRARTRPLLQALIESQLERRRRNISSRGRRLSAGFGPSDAGEWSSSSLERFPRCSARRLSSLSSRDSPRRVSPPIT